MGIYLSKPNTNKDSHAGESEKFKFGVSAMQGWRMNMEDAHIHNLKLTDNAALFAVFDGHGGPEVAKFCAKNFGSELIANPNFAKKDYKTALEETFLKMDSILISPEGSESLREFRNESENQTSYAGCTAIVVLVVDDVLYIANAGDSRAILYTTDGTVVALSTDHKPDVETERARIYKAGGYISEGRVNDNLNLTRAIGDLEYKKNPNLKASEQIISAFPDVLVRNVDHNAYFLVIGCDGIWETLSAKDICSFIESRIKEKPGNKLTPIVEDLLDNLIAKETVEGIGCDNMSCIVVQFKL